MVADDDEFKTPGQLIEALLTERMWTKRVLAIVLEMDETGINRLVADKRPVDAEMAIHLEEVFKVPAERFLGLQKSYDLAKARIKARPDPKRATRAQLYGDLPISEMIKRGWLQAEGLRDPALEKELTRFFGVADANEIEILPHAAKKTHASMDATPAQLAWLYRVRSIASEMLVPRYQEGGADGAIGKLKQLLASAEEIRRAPKILAEAGIRFLIVESLQSAKIDGVCFWLNQQSPVIALSTRFDRIDNFWFVLRHELEHVRRRHGMQTAILDTELEGAKAGTGEGIAEEERQANEAAAEFCVPRKMLDAFIARKNPFFAERDVLAFSNMIKVHPGLIAGQVRHKTGKYNLLGHHLVKVRSIVAPSSIVDGWNDIYPIET